MTRPKWALATAVGFVLLGPGGCGPFPPLDPDDLVLSSIEVTYYNDRTDHWLDSRRSDPTNPRQLRITVATTFDALSAEHRNGAVIHNRFDLCRRHTVDSDSIIIRDYDVFWNGVEISDGQGFRANPGLMDKYKSEAVHKYYAYLFVASRHHPASILSQTVPLQPHGAVYHQAIYDLGKNPEDVCFWLRGGLMFGGTFKSNTVVIPRDAIAKAFTAAR